MSGDDAMRGWVAAIRAAMDGASLDEDALVLGETPEALIDAIPGCRQLPVFHDRRHIAKELDEGPAGHKIPAATLARLPKLLADPIGVWRSAVKPDSRFMILIDAVDAEGKPLCPILDTSGVARTRDTKVDCNFIVTICGRGALAEIISKSDASGSILSIDEERLSELCRKCGITVPANLGRGAAPAPAGEPDAKGGGDQLAARVAVPKTGLGVIVDGSFVPVTPAIVTELANRARDEAVEAVEEWFLAHRYDAIRGDANEFIGVAAVRVMMGMSGDDELDDAVDAVVRRMLADQAP